MTLYRDDFITTDLPTLNI